MRYLTSGHRRGEMTLRRNGIFATKFAYPDSAIPGGSPWSGVARRMSSGNVVRRAPFPKTARWRLKEAGN
jgi:hypothetical protein